MVDLIITGIGGQGTVSLGHLIADTLRDLDIPFIASETHGMSQRGGSVIFHLRIGSYKYSPLIEAQSADCMLAGEPMEALRALSYLKPNGTLITDITLIPSPVSRQMGETNPSVHALLERISLYTSELYALDATKAAKELGNPRMVNIVLLGALISLDILPIEFDMIKDKISKRWPKFSSVNIQALEKGKEIIEEDSKSENLNRINSIS